MFILSASLTPLNTVMSKLILHNDNILPYMTLRVHRFDPLFARFDSSDFSFEEKKKKSMESNLANSVCGSGQTGGF